jgi:hypothetical protein
MTKLRPLLVGLVLLTSARQARAERLVRAYDPRVHIRPPTMKSAIDGQAAELVVDADYLEAAERYRTEHPEQVVLPAPGDVAAVGEIAIVIGDTEKTLTTNGSGYGLQQSGSRRSPEGDRGVRRQLPGHHRCG